MSYDGARWDPINARRLYAIVIGTSGRELWQMEFPVPTPLPATLTLLHNFDTDVATGGYPYSRVQLSGDGRYFAVVLSTFGGQDEYDRVVV